MILDDRLEFFDGLAIPAAGTAVTGDIIDLEDVRDVGQGQDLYWYVAVEDAAAGGTSVQFNLVTDDNSSLSSPTVLASSPVIPIATLNKAKLPVMMGIPAEGTAYERYVGIQTVVVGTFSGGKISSGFTLDKAGYRSYSQGDN